MFRIYPPQGSRPFSPAASTQSSFATSLPPLLHPSAGALPAPKQPAPPPAASSSCSEKSYFAAHPGMRPALKRLGAGAWQMGRPCLHPSPSFDMFTGNRVQNAAIQPCAIPAQAPKFQETTRSWAWLLLSQGQRSCWCLSCSDELLEVQAQKNKDTPCPARQLTLPPATSRTPQGAESPNKLQKSPDSRACSLPRVSFNKQQLTKSLNSL